MTGKDSIRDLRPHIAFAVGGSALIASTIVFDIQSVSTVGLTIVIGVALVIGLFVDRTENGGQTDQ